MIENLRRRVEETLLRGVKLEEYGVIITEERDGKITNVVYCEYAEDATTKYLVTFKGKCSEGYRREKTLYYDKFVNAVLEGF